MTCSWRGCEGLSCCSVHNRNTANLRTTETERLIILLKFSSLLQNISTISLGQLLTCYILLVPGTSRTSRPSRTRRPKQYGRSWTKGTCNGCTCIYLASRQYRQISLYKVHYDDKMLKFHLLLCFSIQRKACKRFFYLVRCKPVLALYLQIFHAPKNQSVFMCWNFHMEVRIQCRQNIA